jgi:photosystem II stability/assembly factor-like uncharacterized protein
MNHTKRWALIAALLASGLGSAGAAETNLAAAQEMPHYGQWQSSRIGGGGYVLQVLATSDPKVYYCFIDNSGMYRSEDGGNTWRMLHGSLPPVRGCYNVRGMIVDPRDDKKIVAALGTRWDRCDGIYLSDDAGRSWHSSHVKTMIFDAADAFRSGGPVLARNPRNPDVVVAASFATGVWRSTDNGMNWTLCGLEEIRPTGVFFDQKNPDRVWLCAQPIKETYRGKMHDLAGGFYESQDAGKTWKKLAADGPVKIAQDPQIPNRLYGNFHINHVEASDDAGRTWRRFSDGLAINEKNLRPDNGFCYKAITAGPDFVLVGSGDSTLYRLGPGETTWRKVPRESVDMAGSIHTLDSAMSNITIDPRDPKHWLFTDFFAIYQSYDAGRTWKSTIHGLELTVIHQVLQDPSDPAVVHVVMADLCYFTSLDGGKSFIYHHAAPLKNPAQEAIQIMALSAKDIDLSPKLPSRLYAVGSVGWNQHMNQVYVSADRGDRWEKSPMIGLANPEILSNLARGLHSLSVDPDDPNTVYVALSGPIKKDSGGVYRTSDGGKHWTWLGQGLPETANFFFAHPWGHGKEVAAGPGGKLLAISTTDGRGVYRYDAAAKTWIKSKLAVPPTAELHCLAADLLRPGRFFLGVRRDGIYRTDDAGVSWKKVYGESAAYVATDHAVGAQGRATLRIGTKSGTYYFGRNPKTTKAAEGNC